MRTVIALIAVGVDATDNSRRALAWAAREAVRRGAVLQVVTAWTSADPDTAPSAPTTPPAATPPSGRVDADRIQREAIAEVVDVMENPPPVTRQVVRASAAQALVEASHRADLVVVGTHGRGPVHSQLLGSVSLSVIQKATCPVVVMPEVRTPADR